MPLAHKAMRYSIKDFAKPNIIQLLKLNTRSMIILKYCPSLLKTEY